MSFRLKTAENVDISRISSALREAADHCENGAVRRFNAEDELWDATETETVTGLLRSLADDVQAETANITALNYAEHITAEEPVEERLELFVYYGTQNTLDLHCSVTYVPSIAIDNPKE